MYGHYGDGMGIACCKGDATYHARAILMCASHVRSKNHAGMGIAGNPSPHLFAYRKSAVCHAIAAILAAFGRPHHSPNGTRRELAMERRR